MDELDIGLLGAICREGMSTFYDQKITLDMIEDGRARVAFQFIEEHWKAYSDVPKPETIRQQTGIDVLIAPVEPLEYWCNEIRKRSLWQGLTDGLKDVVQLVDNTEPEKAFVSLQALVYKLGQDVTIGDRPAPMFSNPQEIWDHYEKAKKGLLGIPTPWPTMNKITKGWQPADLVLFAARPGSGKCHSPDTTLLMFDGSFKRADEIKVGDQLMGPDSKPRNVLSTCRGREEMFEVIPVKGESWKCNRSHILSLRMSSDNGSVYKKDQIFNLTIDEYLAKNNKFKHHAKLWRTGVEFPKKYTPFVFEIGFWLLSYEDDNPLHVALTKYYGTPTKIPKIYLINDRSTRIQLLGIMIELDGYIDGDILKINLEHEELKDDFLFLCRSLGFAAYAFKDDLWIISIYGELSLIPCEALNLSKLNHHDFLNTGFELKSIGEGEYYGFELDGDHLYLLSDFTVTHNTFILLMIIKWAWENNYKILLGSTEMSHIKLCFRLAALICKLSYGAINDGALNSEQEKYFRHKLFDELYKDNRLILVGDGFDVTLNSIEAAIIEFKPDLVCIDGIYNLKSFSKSTAAHERFGEIFSHAKALAKRRKIPIIAATQMNRGGKSGGRAASEKADLERLAFSDAAARDADYVFFLNQTNDQIKARELELQPAKQRESQFVKNIKLNWKFDVQDFSEILDDEDKVDIPSPDDTPLPEPFDYINDPDNVPEDDPW